MKGRRGVGVLTVRVKKCKVGEKTERMDRRKGVTGKGGEQQKVRVGG